MVVLHNYNFYSHASALPAMREVLFNSLNVNAVAPHKLLHDWDSKTRGSVFFDERKPREDFMNWYYVLFFVVVQ